jgi:hypothetical protein
MYISSGSKRAGEICRNKLRIGRSMIVGMGEEQHESKHTEKSRSTSPYHRRCDANTVYSSEPLPGMGRSTRCTLCCRVYVRLVIDRYWRRNALVKPGSSRAGPGGDRWICLVRIFLAHRDLCRMPKGGGQSSDACSCMKRCRNSLGGTLMKDASQRPVRRYR